MKKTILAAALISISVLAARPAHAEPSKAQTNKLVKRMLTDCSTELSKDPALKDTKDGEAIWNNLEAKEHISPLSTKCDAAEEAYEKVFHKDIWQAEEAEEAKAKK